MTKQNLAYKLLIFDWEGTLADPSHIYPTQLFPNTLKVLTNLHQQGYLLAIATAKSKAGLVADLIQTGLKSIIDITCTAQESAPKPNPAMLFYILEELAIKPQDALMIGDTIYDLSMAKQADIAGLAVSSGGQTRAELLKYQPLDCLDVITQLPNWLTHRMK
jgi:phosphoglycolate phosphatase